MPERNWSNSAVWRAASVSRYSLIARRPASGVRSSCPTTPSTCSIADTASFRLMRSRSSPSARLRSVMSRTILAAPTTRPWASRTGETLTDTCSVRPSLATRTVSYGPKCSPALTHCFTRSVSSCLSGGTRTAPGRPRMSPARYPYSASAPPFQLVTSPSRLSA